MPYLYLASSVILVTLESILGGFYSRKNDTKKDPSALYSLLVICSVFAFWAVMFILDFSFDVGVLLYAVLFAVCFTVYNLAIIQALRTGPMGLTSLFSQLALIGTTIWGFIFWNSEFTLMVGIGLTLVVVAICLCLYTGKAENERKVNLKWLIYAVLVFASNAGCSIIQRTQQMKFNGQHGSLLMFIATALSVLICLVMYLKSDKSDSKEIIKGSWYIPTVAGVSNGFLNLLVILMASSTLSPSLIYPVIGVGGLMITTSFSAFIFKEKLFWWQWVGIAVGIVAVGILSV